MARVAPVANDATLGRELLEQVSRSFYLTLRLLPEGFREPMSIGYLLARATDTVADTEAVAIPARVESLGLMQSLIRDGGKVDEFRDQVESTFVPKQAHEGEKELLLRFDECLAALNAQSPALQKHTRFLMEQIVKGQAGDLTRFPELPGEEVVCLRSDDELEEYTYLVAGCVGEFWTKVGLEVDRGFPAAKEAELLRLGKNYGKGLQLVNILRDFTEDLGKGRCYLPVASGTLAPDQAGQMRGVASEWSATARSYLLDGVAYTSKLRGLRLKMATGLPALLGLRTLDLLEEKGWSLKPEKLKISRAEVKYAVRQSLSLSLVPGAWARHLRRLQAS